MAFMKVVQRKHQTVLITSYFYRGQERQYFERILGIPGGLTTWKLTKEGVFCDDREFNSLADIAWKMGEKNGIDWLLSRLDVCYEYGDRLMKYADELKSVNFSKMPMAALRAAFAKFVEKNLDFGPSVYYPLTAGARVEDAVKKRLARAAGGEGLLLALTSPVKLTDSDRELRDFYLLAADAQEIGLGKMLAGEPKAALKKIARESPVFIRMLKKHLEKYAWLGSRWLVGDAWTMDDLVKRLASVMGGDCAAKFRELNSAPAKNRAEAQRVIEELGFSKKERETVWAAKEFVYFRSYRTELYSKAGFIAKPLLVEIARRLKIGYEDIVNCTFEEIESFLAGGAMDRGKILERRKSRGLFCDGEKMFVLSGKELADYLKKQEAKAAGTASPKPGKTAGGKAEATGAREVRGFPASYGTASGTARVIMGSDEFRKMRDGDVLVTTMTTPEFVPMMQKACAIVTDEGGILCHAAIVSRELGKPCIIGTKNATKIIKDGEKVFVDATAGIVKRTGRK